MLRVYVLRDAYAFAISRPRQLPMPSLVAAWRTIFSLYIAFDILLPRHDAAVMSADVALPLMR